MKDYEQVYEACKILDSYIKKQSKFNLSAEHDTLFLCFDVLPKSISMEHTLKLQALGCIFDNGQWYMHTSC